MPLPVILCNYQLLDLVFRSLKPDKYGDIIGFPPCGKAPEGIFNVPIARRIGNIKRTRSMILEEERENLFSLALARNRRGRQDGYLEIVRKPSGKSLGVSKSKIFRDGNKHIVTSRRLVGPASYRKETKSCQQ